MPASLARLKLGFKIGIVAKGTFCPRGCPFGVDRPRFNQFCLFIKKKCKNSLISGSPGLIEPKSGSARVINLCLKSNPETRHPCLQAA